MEKGTLVIDDISHYETERMIEIYKPDVFCAGIKEKFVIQKMGVPCKQLHNYDFGGPYAGFEGAGNFYREIDRLVNTRIWKLIPPLGTTPMRQTATGAMRQRATRAMRRQRPKGGEGLSSEGRWVDTGARRAARPGPEVTHSVTTGGPWLPGLPGPVFMSGGQAPFSSARPLPGPFVSFPRRILMLLKHTPKEVVERNALTINPAKTCMPIGAMYAALGIHSCLPHSHGSQGCCAYHRSMLTRHFREPVMAATSSFTEGSSVFGGQSNLLAAIENIFTIYNPEVIAVHTTCLSETIGDDINQIITKAKDDGKIPAGQVDPPRQHAQLRRLARDRLRPHDQGDGRVLLRARRHPDRADQHHSGLGRAVRHAGAEAPGVGDEVSKASCSPTRPTSSTRRRPAR